METGKPGLASAPARSNLVRAQMEKRMEIQSPLMALYIPAVSALAGPPVVAAAAAAAQEHAALHLAVPPAHSKDTLPFVTLHFTGSLQPQRGLSLAAAAPAPRPKSAGKHVCPHCGRDCLKPSVLEKHLRCHTGERPFPCTTCGISFKTQSNLYKHKRTQAHARLSSESDQSLDSMSSSRETCSSSMSLEEHQEEPGSTDNDVALPASDSTCSDGSARVCFTRSYPPVGERNESMATNHQAGEPASRTDVSQSLHRHVPLQRQEATLFSKQWESSVSKGKSQSHESTDSGFSESSDLYQSPISVLPDHSQDCLAESAMEHLEETAKKASPMEELSEEAKATARQQEKMNLEQRISKLISENTAVVEDKQLENVRPRKTVLSKQGSIDLPMPYMYKDSFHFDMRINKAPGVGLQRSRKPDFYSSVPTQQSTSSPPEHAPLTRSHSLPFSVALLPPERTGQSLSQSHYATLVRRGSSGQLNPTGFAVKPANQQSSTHRPLVRQAAVDCNHATDGLCKNSSAEEAGTGTMCCDGDGSEIGGEPGNRKFRRRKAQKFAYNKWYMYGGGTFKKLYNTEAGAKESGTKGRKGPTKPDPELLQGLQRQPSGVHQAQVTAAPDPTIRFTSGGAPPDGPSAKLSFASTLDFNLKTTQVYTSCSSLKNPFRRILSLSALPVPINEPACKAKSASSAAAEGQTGDNSPPGSSSKLCESQSPSDRKKQRTDEKVACPSEMETDPIPTAAPSHSATGIVRHPATTFVSRATTLTHAPLKGAVIPCVLSGQSLTVITPRLTSTPSTTKTSFLPKYQLKLPNAAQSEPPLDTADKVPVSFGASSPPCTETTSLPAPTTQSCTGSEKTSATVSTQSQPPLPRTVTTQCKAESAALGQYATTDHGDSLQSAAAVTTVCPQENQAELHCTSVQAAKYQVRSSPAHSPESAAAVVVDDPVTASVTTGSDGSDCCSLPQTDAHARPSQAAGQSNLVSRSSRASVHTSAVTTRSLHCEQKLLPAQSVFHVRTGDLQICLQIISDEQLALIEPQIERQADGDFPQRPRAEAVQSSQGSAPKSHDAWRSAREDGNHQQPGAPAHLDKSNSGCPVLKRMITQLAVQVEEPESNMCLAESDPTEHTATSAASQAPEALGQSQGRTYGHVHTVAATQESVMDAVTTEASREVLLSVGRSQMFSEEPQKHTTHVQDMDAVCSQTSFIQQSPRAKSPAFTSLNHSSSTRVKHVVHQNQASSPGTTCNFATTEVKSSASLGGIHPSILPVRLQLTTGTTRATERSAAPCPISKYRAARQLRPQESIYCSDPAECVSSQTHRSSQRSTGANGESPVVAPPPSNELQKEPRDSLTPAQKDSTVTDSRLIPPAAQSQVERPTYDLAASTSPQSPSAGLREGDSPAGLHLQEKTQPQEQRATLKRRNLQHFEDQGDGALLGEGQSKGLRTNQQPGLWSHKGSEEKQGADSCQNSPPERPPPHLSHTEMSAYPQHGPQRSPSSSLCSLAPSVSNSLALSQQWENIHSPSAQVFRASNVHQQIKAAAQARAPQSCFALIKSCSENALVHHQEQDQQTVITPPASNCCTAVLAPSRHPESDAITSSRQQAGEAQPSEAAAALTAETPAFSDVLDSNAFTSKCFACPENVDYNDAKDSAAQRHAGESSNSGPIYSSFFFLGHHQDYPAAESQSSAVRPVPSCQEHMEDTSSSDDEGKLIIEL